MINILFIVPYPELKDVVESVIKKHPDKSRLNINIIVATVDKLPDIDVSKCDIIIARGYTARQAKKRCASLPTVELTISSYDIIRSLQECKTKFSPKKVAFCGFYEVLYGAKEFGHLFECEVEVYTPSNYEDLYKAIIEAKQHGCEAIIGGYSAILYSQKAKINSIVIRTGEEAVFQALNEAIRTIDLLREERIKAEIYRTITKSSKEGIIYVDKDGIIRVDNKIAQDMAQGNALCHIKLEDAFPFLEINFHKAMESGKEVSNEIYTLMNNTMISASFLPVAIGKEVSGVVINLTYITRVQELESQIRRKLSEKGLRAKYNFNDIIYKSDVMKKTIEKAKLYALSSSNIIIVGETGTGKEIFAQSIHNSSLRKNGPFVAVNCAALPENLLESELFGYVEGAFTGTKKGGKMGLFEQAHNGTIFLDEISEITPALQSKLLRVLQEHEVRRIGDDKVISINVRIISATNRNLNSLVQKGKFRKDLMYRLDVLRLFLPPLRKRGDDIEELFLYFFNKMSRKSGKHAPKIDRPALQLLHDYRFSGNIRELANIAERVFVLNNGTTIDKNVLEKALYPDDIEPDEAEYEKLDKESNISLHAMKCNSEMEMVKWALDKCEGNQTKAAKLLGIDRTTLWRKIKKYNVDIKYLES
ncbi:MAG TPA: sigma-54-dependent Fis family transcriptional regulator [Clostridiaceae bacterium]|nr:sigma-54-dependent Fis family transcriptional regulator [Clostridiaceae bacterium]